MNENEIRLVNASILTEKTTDWGTKVLSIAGGAWGRPAEALAAARKRIANERPVGYRIVGICITDVRTGERWAVPA